MLLRFRLANHRSIREEHELSLIGTEFNEGTARETVLRNKGRAVTVLPVASVFGANASGKSNLLSGLRFMRTAVRDSVTESRTRPGSDLDYVRTAIRRDRTISPRRRQAPPRRKPGARLPAGTVRRDSTDLGRQDSA